MSDGKCCLFCGEKCRVLADNVKVRLWDCMGNGDDCEKYQIEKYGYRITGKVYR